MLGKWIDALRPVSRFLGGPLADIIQDERLSESAKIAACEAVAAYATDDPGQFQELEKRLAIPVPGDTNDEHKTTLAKQKADIAAALLRMNQYERMRGVLKHTPDPTVRSYLIQRISPWAIDVKTIWKGLQQEEEPSIRRALILALGEFAPESLAPAEREAVISQLVESYRDDPDPGIHGATEWVLRRCKQDTKIKAVRKEVATGKVEGNRLWYVTRQGHTMVVIPGPVEYMGGALLKEIRIARGFAIADKDVTVEQFLRFRKDHKDQASKSDCPVTKVSWHDAAAYCNWLSEEEGIPENQWCYEPASKKPVGDGMKIRLGREGYRLPSEWEWEYACRAGSVTAYSFGEPVELLGRYGWSLVNSNSRPWPVGTLRPNDLGLCDMHGNVCQWCQDILDAADSDGGMIPVPLGDSARVLRGGAFDCLPPHLRSAHRDGFPSGGWGDAFGFRPARTCPITVPPVSPGSVQHDSPLIPVQPQHVRLPDSPRPAPQIPADVAPLKRPLNPLPSPQGPRAAEAIPTPAPREKANAANQPLELSPDRLATPLEAPFPRKNGINGVGEAPKFSPGVEPNAELNRSTTHAR